MTTVAVALARARAGYELRLRELKSWLAIPSVSGDPQLRADVVRAGSTLVDFLHRSGARTTSISTRGAPPVVVGQLRGPPGSPVVVVYGHYDVVPAGKGWTSPAFAPVVRGGVLFGRGSNDDKGQLFAVVAALHAWCEAGRLPATVVVIAEGAEEVGSPGLASALAKVSRRVRPDVVVACDTERDAAGVPTVTVSQRGLVLLDMVVDVGGPPVHAGRLGGAVVDPSIVLSRVVLDMRTALERSASTMGLRSDDRRVKARDDSSVTRAAGGRAMAGTELDRRINLRPALSVIGLRAGDGASAVPGRATARLDVRLPATWDAAATVRMLQRIARRQARAGVSVEIKVRAAQPGFGAVPKAGLLHAVDEACVASFGKPAALVRSGGSLPAARLLATAFGMPPVLLGLGTPAGGAHGPDEHLDIAGWQRSVDLLVRLVASPELKRGDSRPQAGPAIYSERVLL